MTIHQRAALAVTDKLDRSEMGDLILDACCEIEQKDAEIAKLRRCISFFASVIKSGEQWTEQCERDFEDAMGRPHEQKVGDE